MIKSFRFQAEDGGCREVDGIDQMMLNRENPAPKSFKLFLFLKMGCFGEVCSIIGMTILETMN
jgi:hypothetical protein